MLVLQFRVGSGVVIGPAEHRLYVDKIVSEDEVMLRYETPYLDTRKTLLRSQSVRISQDVVVSLGRPRKEAMQAESYDSLKFVSLGFTAPKRIGITRIEKFDKWQGHYKGPRRSDSDGNQLPTANVEK